MAYLVIRVGQFAACVTLDNGRDCVAATRRMMAGSRELLARPCAKLGQETK